MPTREEALHAQGDDEICDLDVIISRRVTFTFKGRARDILPITTERLFAFWAATQDFQKANHKTPEAADEDFYKIMKTVCDDLTLEESMSMTVVQKSNLLEHITRKITGQAPVLDLVKKKVMLPQSA